MCSQSGCFGPCRVAVHSRNVCVMTSPGPLRVQPCGSDWEMVGTGAESFGLINEFLGYLADRAYSAQTVRAYAFDLLAFARWLLEQRIALEEISTEVLLRFLTACRTAVLPDRRGDNVFSIWDGRNSGYAATTINRRLAAISGLFAYRAMRHPELPNPVPRGREARRTAKGERAGLLGHLAKPRPRSGEVLSLQVRDVDIPRGWVRVIGKGDKERRVPMDPDVAGLVQTYLLAERPETDAREVFVVAKGPHRGERLTPAGLRTIFRYHRARSGLPAGHPHALRHTFGTALAEAGVDLAVLQALMGHNHVDSSVVYIHLAPVHLRAAYDAARNLQSSRS